ncbi:transposase, partial [Nonomuraea mangrovi]
LVRHTSSIDTLALSLQLRLCINHLDASSGDQIRHRLNTGGNRQLNSALHTIAVCQARDPGPGRVYYQRKITENKTPAEARRAPKRRLSNVIYRHIRKDQQRVAPAAA